jgi:RNA polymerase sigma factor (sigma-70 family)
MWPMQETEGLAAQFEADRARLRGVAYRMLGSRTEAEDAVQEAWIRLSRAGSNNSSIENLNGWLTTVVARVCLDMLRARRARREEPLSLDLPVVNRGDGSDPEQEALLADSVGLALLVVLETLSPAERVAFVLHDVFDVQFDEIAPIVGRTPTAARQLASRARRRVQGASAVAEADLARRREVVDAFLAAARGGDFEALIAVLDPDVLFRSDAAAAKMGGPQEARGATVVAKLFSGRAHAAKSAILDGAVAVVVAPKGRLIVLLFPTVKDGKIVRIEAVADPQRLSRVDLAVLSS